MSLRFHQAVENMDVWSASGADISFVVTFASPTGPGFHGRRGFLASWRPFYSSKGAVEVTGSPFETFAEAERACNTKLEELEAGRAYSSKQRGTAVGEPHVGTTLVPEEPAENISALDPGAEVIATTTSE
jgi:hypothetical protein